MMLVQKIFCFTSVGRWNVIKIYISKKLVWELEELRNTNTQWMFFSWILTFHAIVTPNLYLALDRKFWGKKVSFQTIIFWKIKPTNVLQKYLSTDSSFADKNNDNKIIIWRIRHEPAQKKSRSLLKSKQETLARSQTYLLLQVLLVSTKIYVSAGQVVRESFNKCIHKC